MKAIMSFEDGLGSIIRLGPLGVVPGHWTIKLCFMTAPAE